MKRNDQVKILCGFVCTVIMSLPGSANGQTYDVTPLGSFAPPGSQVQCGKFPADTPYMLIESAIVFAPNSTIRIAPGYYRQPGVYSTPAVLEAPMGGVVIGSNAEPSTSFKLAALNTHMAGDTIFPSWADDARTRDIADICKAKQWDFVGFSEIWDEDFFCESCCEDCNPDGSVTFPLLERSGYAYGTVGDTCSGDLIHSGLAVMSRVEPITFFQQYDFQDCPENPCDCLDCFANKGFVWSRFQKDGFDINVITTHMQAETGYSFPDCVDPPDNSVTRLEQMSCIRNQILAHRPGHPKDVYFIVGDTNVPGESLEYYCKMSASLTGLFNDAAPNAPGFVHAQQVTNSAANPLSLCFDCDTGESRLDYILFTPQSLDGSVKVLPIVTQVFKFLSGNLTDDCDECPDADLTTNQKSDHWAVEGQYEIYRID